jgi:phosphoglycerate dehydrogenase-like enzyme
MTFSIIKTLVCKLAFLVATVLLILFSTLSASANAPLTIEQLVERFGLWESDTATKDHPLYRKPQKVVVWNRAPLIDALRKAHPKINFVPVSNMTELTTEIVDADVFLGFCAAPLKELETRLTFIHSLSVGVEGCATSDILKKQGVLVANIQKMSGPQIAEHAIAMMMSLVRGLDKFQNAQRENKWDRNAMPGNAIWEIEGRTMLVIGLGGIGREVAKRAHGLGMKVTATRNSSRNGPDYVDYVGLSDELGTLVKQADVVVNTVPLTDKTYGMVDKDIFSAMKSTAYYISVGRGATTNQADLVAALNKGTIAGAGLDVTDPEPLPAEHPLWNIPSVIITPHMAARSDKYIERVQTLVLENFQRYVDGRPILNEVNLERGY